MGLVLRREDGEHRRECLSIGVGEMRAVVAMSARRPSLGRWQVVVIEDADRLTEGAANALLKAVEEPPERTMFLLWERLKMVVEPTGALGAAAALHRGNGIRGKRVGVILSGGNVDFAAVLARAAGRGDIRKWAAGEDAEG